MAAGSNNAPQAVCFPKQTWTRRDGIAMLSAAGVTMVVELGAFVLARRLGLADPGAVVVFLAVACAWLALAPAALAAGGKSGLSVLLRGGVVADATGAALLVLWLTTPCVRFWPAVQLYCLAWSIALVAISAVWIARKPVGRLLAAVVVAMLFSLSLTSLIWLGAWIGRSPGPHDTAIATWAAGINPFCAMTSVVAQDVHFVWTEWGKMYLWSPVGEYAMPAPTPWYETCLLYVSTAAGFCCAVLLRCGFRRWRDRL